MALYSGNDDMIAPLMSLGALGVISVASNLFPKKLCQLTKAALEGKGEEALRRQLELLPLIHALFAEVSPIPCKFAMEEMGLCSGEMRLPLIRASESVQKMLLKAISELHEG